MHPRFGGHAVIVTGGAQGIGAAIARRLAAEGARVLIADIDGDGAKRTADVIGRGAEGVRCDVADTASVQAAVEHAVSLYGGLDVLVNNAFRAAGLATLPDLPEDDWLSSFDVTLHGAYRATRAALP
ncbi:SDR family NAD(P)-dependent oxidoreductase, partial [Streptomyces sp. A7024]